MLLKIEATSEMLLNIDAMLLNIDIHLLKMDTRFRNVAKYRS